MNDLWYSEIDKIYKQYKIYNQSGGMEQSVFLNANGIGEARSEKVAENSQHIKLPPKGVALDYGCGNGAFLKALTKRINGWSLHGLEYSDKYKKKSKTYLKSKNFLLRI